MLGMASVIVIPLIIVAIAGLSGYLAYKFLIYDLICKRNVSQTLHRFNIKKTPAQIIKEYYDFKGEEISNREIQSLEKNYRQNEPDQFLAMYDAVRDRIKNKEKK